jgi:polyisoprenoid-binding protein YceI
MNKEINKTMKWSGRIVAGMLLATAFLSMPARGAARDGLLRFQVNPGESEISASVAEPMAMIRGNAVGTFKVTKGEVQGDPSAIAGTGKVTLAIDAASYQTNSDSRDRDVKEKALEVGEFPTITFESTGISNVQSDGKAGTGLLSGRLTLHGVTKDIEVPITVQLDGQGRLVSDGSYSFKFEEYGVKRPSKMMGLMTTGDTATITFHVIADPV